MIRVLTPQTLLGGMTNGNSWKSEMTASRGIDYNAHETKMCMCAFRSKMADHMYGFQWSSAGSLQ